MCMGMGTIGIPWVPWDFHGHGSDNDYIMHQSALEALFATMRYIN